MKALKKKQYSKPVISHLSPASLPTDKGHLSRGALTSTLKLKLVSLGLCTTGGKLWTGSTWSWGQKTIK